MASKILVGAHVSIAKHPVLAFERGESIGCTAIQIFTKSSRSWNAKDFSLEEIATFKKRALTSPIKHIAAHAGYLINIGSPKNEIEHQSIDALIFELQRCAQLNIPYLIMHPGAHLGSGEKICIEKIAKNITDVLEQTDITVSIILETTAGQGTTVGYTFEHINTIRSLSPQKKRIGVCLDTCHIFSAGYDITSENGYHKVIKQFDDIIGLSHLKVIHLNNSQGKLGSKIDRHEPLEKGHIPVEIFKLIMNDTKLAAIPKILETPTDDAMSLWAKEIELLKSFVA